jgi:hypothetical protein
MAYNYDRKSVIDKLLMMLLGEWRRKLPEIFFIECMIARKLRESCSEIRFTVNHRRSSKNNLLDHDQSRQAKSWSEQMSGGDNQIIWYFT